MERTLLSLHNEKIREQKGGVCVKIFMATSFFLGILFLFLAARGFRKTRGWFGARRLLADVVEVEYQDVWEKKDVISEAASRIRVTLQFFCDERRIVRDREYQGILRTSFRRGEKVPVFYDPETGQWIPRGEVRWNWLWQLLVALFFCFLPCVQFWMGGGWPRRFRIPEGWDLL